jgi:hypothetical protein
MNGMVLKISSVIALQRVNFKFSEYHIQKKAKATNTPKVTTPAKEPRLNDALSPLRGNNLENVLIATPAAAIGAIVLRINVVNVNFLSPLKSLYQKGFNILC